MKNAILVIVSLAVGYGLAYFCASRHLAPFNNIEAHHPKGDAVKTDESVSAEKVMVKQVSQKEMERLSNNYVAWISNLAAKASKGVPKKDLSKQAVIRGGVLSANLLKMLAKGNKDVHYIFGKESYSSPIYMLLTNTAADGSPETGALPEATASLPYIDAVDSASMCPPICNEIIFPGLPPNIIDMPLPPPPPDSGDED